jgi:hypothetical protein
MTWPRMELRTSDHLVYQRLVDRLPLTSDFGLNHFETNERFPEFAPFGAFDEISSVSPSINSEGISTGSGCGTRESAIISGAPSIVSAWAKEKKVPCGLAGEPASVNNNPWHEAPSNNRR